MPDWGTKIFDAAGQLHDLSVNAFDSLSSATPHKALAYGGPILSQKFETLYGSYRDKLSEATGIEMPTDVENLSVFGEGLKKSASKAIKIGGQVVQSGNGSWCRNGRPSRNFGGRGARRRHWGF